MGGGVDLGGKSAGAEHGGEQGVGREVKAVRDLKLQLESVHVAAARGVVEQRAALVDDRHLIGGQAGNRRGDEETERLHLAVRKRAAVLQRQHHRGGGGFVFADEQAGFGGGDMDARALDRVDRLDRARQEIGRASCRDRVCQYV